jgi:hypothetical protein
MPGDFNTNLGTHNYLWLRQLHLSPQKDQPGLQNASKRQILPIFEGEPEKQKLPRQILPIRIYPDLFTRDQAETATDSFRTIGK